MHVAYPMSCTQYLVRPRGVHLVSDIDTLFPSTIALPPYLNTRLVALLLCIWGHPLFYFFKYLIPSIRYVLLQRLPV
jgi:hypothetical protein